MQQRGKLQNPFLERDKQLQDAAAAKPCTGPGSFGKSKFVANSVTNITTSFGKSPVSISTNAPLTKPAPPPPRRSVAEIQKETPNAQVLLNSSSSQAPPLPPKKSSLLVATPQGPVPPPPAATKQVLNQFSPNSGVLSSPAQPRGAFGVILKPTLTTKIPSTGGIKAAIKTAEVSNNYLHTSHSSKGATGPPKPAKPVKFTCKSDPSFAAISSSSTQSTTGRNDVDYPSTSRSLKPAKPFRPASPTPSASDSVIETTSSNRTVTSTTSTYSPRYADVRLGLRPVAASKRETVLSAQERRVELWNDDAGDVSDLLSNTYDNSPPPPPPTARRGPSLAARIDSNNMTKTPQLSARNSDLVIGVTTVVPVYKKETNIPSETSPNSSKSNTAALLSKIFRRGSKSGAKDSTDNTVPSSPIGTEDGSVSPSASGMKIREGLLAKIIPIHRRNEMGLTGAAVASTAAATSVADWQDYSNSNNNDGIAIDPHFTRATGEFSTNNNATQHPPVQKRRSAPPSSDLVCGSDTLPTTAIREENAVIIRTLSSLWVKQSNEEDRWDNQASHKPQHENLIQTHVYMHEQPAGVEGDSDDDVWDDEDGEQVLARISQVS